MSCYNNECAICFDDIDVHINCITTECNHRFHSTCFLTNAAKNGFNCPMCRTELAEQQEDSDSDSDGDGDDDDSTDVTVIQPLSGFRWLFQRAEGELIEEDDPDDFNDSNSDSETLSSDNDDELSWKRDDINALSITEITEKIVEKQISMRDLVAFFVRPHQNQLADCDEFDETFMKKMSNILDPMMGYE